MSEQPIKILLIEDERALREALADALTSEGFVVTQAETGAAGLDAFRTATPDLILLDLMLPEMGGIEVCRSIRSSSRVPIIMVTAKDSPDDVASALKLGANDYLAKPVNIDIAVARIETQLSVCDLYRENIRRHQQDSINAMIVAFNHEINNPLAIAMGNLSLGMARNDMEALQKAEVAMRRIADIIKKINELTKGKGIELTSYADSTKMIKL